jgi:hypothetical protein
MGYHFSQPVTQDVYRVSHLVQVLFRVRCHCLFSVKFPSDIGRTLPPLYHIYRHVKRNPLAHHKLASTSLVFANILERVSFRTTIFISEGSD